MFELGIVVVGGLLAYKALLNIRRTKDLADKFEKNEQDRQDQQDQ